MATADSRRIERQVGGEGRFVVSEGVAPAEWILPHESLPTLYKDIEDDRYETVLTMGTIVSVVEDANGDPRLVPANGSGSAQEHGTDLDQATPVDAVTVEAESVPIGAVQYDGFRPFDKGTSQGVAVVARSYVEWPLVEGLNDDIVAGDLVRADNLGRAVKCTKAEAAGAPHLVVGRVFAVEKFASNFNDGLLSYMQLPSDPGALRTVYELTKSGTNQGLLGIPANLNVEDAVGAFRVNLSI